MYIGEKKIKDQTEIEGKVKIAFEDGSTATFTKKMYEASFTMEPINLTKLQERRITAVQSEFMSLLLEWDIQLSDIPNFLQWSSNYIQHKHELADEKLWGNRYLERTIGDLEAVLQQKTDKSDKV